MPEGSKGLITAPPPSPLPQELGIAASATALTPHPAELTCPSPRGGSSTNVFHQELAGFPACCVPLPLTGLCSYLPTAEVDTAAPPCAGHPARWEELLISWTSIYKKLVLEPVLHLPVLFLIFVS